MFCKGGYPVLSINQHEFFFVFIFQFPWAEFYPDHYNKALPNLPYPKLEVSTYSQLVKGIKFFPFFLTKRV